MTNQNISNGLFHLSGYAVDMFFVVSGFLIFWSFDNQQAKKIFYIKRFFRVFPLYLFLIILQTVFFIVFSDFNIFEIIKYFLSNILFLNFLAHSVGDVFVGLQINAINGSLWTLKNEVLFYLILPYIFYLFKKFGIKFLIYIYLISCIYFFIVDYFEYTRLIVQFPAQLRLFLSGIFMYLFLDTILKSKITTLVPFLLIVIYLFIDCLTFKIILYPILISIVVMCLVFCIKHIKINFDFSYSFYIFHFPIIQLSLYFNFNHDNPFISFFTLFFIILMLSYFSEKYIEDYFIQLGKKIIKRRKYDTN